MAGNLPAPSTGNPVVDVFVAAVSWLMGGSKVATAIRWTATAITIGTGIKGFMEAKELMSKGQDILGQKTSQGGKIPVIYGRRRVGSTVVFMNTADNRSKDLFLVYALSVGEIDQIELDTIEINGVSIKDPKVFRQGYYAGSDKIASGAGSLCTFDQRGTVTAENAGGSGTDPAQRYRMVFNAHHGADDQTADPMLIASSGGQWTSSHRVRGIAYLACSFEYDVKGMFNSIPQLTVVCRGKKLYDPRKDGSITGGTGSHRYATPSTFEWSDNATLCLLDYMRDNQYGKGLAETDINLQTFQSAATTAETKQDTPDYDGSYAASTFSGLAGTGVIIVDEDTWKTAKIGANLNLKDNAGNFEFVDNQIVDATRYQPFDASAIYQVIVKNALANTYTNEAGQALVKVERFSCNGVINANKNILENTQELLANMRGILNYINGKYEITLEDTASSSFTVTDRHIIGDSGITVTYEDKAQKANKVVVQFFNALKKYEMDTVTLLHDASPNFTSDDGGEELELVVDFPYIVNKYVAYNMGKAILGRSRNQQTISFNGVPELYKVKVGDVITVVYTPLGYTGKLFRVEAMILQPNGLVGVQAIEYLDIYTWQAPPQEIIEPINNPVAYFAVKAPTGITFTDAGSSSTGRSFLTWDEPTDYPNHQYRIRIVDSSSNKLTNKIVDQEFVDLNYLPVGSNYVASVSAINSINEESSAATLTFSVSTPPVATADVKDDAITLAKVGADVISAIDAGGTNSTQLIKATSAPTIRTDGSALQPQDLWADTDDNNQIYVRNAANNDWVKARDSSLVTLYNTLSNTVGTNTTNIATAQGDIVTLTTNTSANAQAITNLTATTGTNAAAISAEQTARTNADSALAQDITTLNAEVDTNTAAISSEAVTRASADSALSGLITNLNAEVDTNTANVSINTSAVATINGNAAASYVLKLNANGKVAQMVLNSNASSGSGATSTIAFLADTFKIDNDAGTSISPFYVTGGTVYINNARINELEATKLKIDDVTISSDGSGNLIIKSNGVNTAQIQSRATSVFATATGGIGTWNIDNLPQTGVVTTAVFQAPTNTENNFMILGNTSINANSGSSTADWCELQVQRRSASTSGGVASASYVTIATIRKRGETGEALQSIVANDSYTADYYYQYRVTLQTNGTGTLFGTRSYGISGIQVIVTYR
jgi:hypothetical protein